MWFLNIPGVNDRKEFMKYWGPIAKRVGLELTIKEPINWGGRLDLHGENLKVSSKRIKIQRKDNRYELVLKRHIRCPHVQSYLFVLHDGTVVPCCNIQEGDSQNEIVFSSLNESNILNIWNGYRYLTFKHDHFKKNIGKYPYCSKCTEVIRFDSIKLDPKYYILKFRNYKKRN